MPRDAAVILPLRHTPAGKLNVFLVKRAQHLRFLGGFHAFPGGTLDPGDHALAREGLAADAFVSALARELFEELGVFLSPRLAETLDVPRAVWRQKIMDDPECWPRWIRRVGGLPHFALVPMGYWVTPPFSNLIYRARYYAAWLPERESPTVCAREHESGQWLSSDEALSMHDRGDIFLSYPVLETLKVIVDCNDNIERASRHLQSRDGTYPHAGGQMLAGVHVIPVRTPTLPPATHTNSYVVGREGLVVIDPATPYAEEQQKLTRYLDHLVSRGSRLVEIWLTHHHRDHIGAAALLRERFGIPIAAHRLTAERLRGELHVDRAIEDGELRVFCGSTDDHWRALHTPGHAPGHLCFYEERLGTLLSGDLVLSASTVAIAEPDGDMALYFDSLKRVAELPRHGFMLPAHGPPVATAQARILETLDHRRQREIQILNAISTPHTIDGIFSAIYPEIDATAATLAKATIASHLRKLTDEGAAERRGAGEWIALTQN